MVAGLTLVCPVRGRLKATGRARDGLTPTEERYRVEAIKHLISRGYPAQNFVIEAVIKRFGSGGRNSFRADFVVLDSPAASISPRNVDDLLAHAVLLCEVKRDNAASSSATSYQVKPMLDFAARSDCVALYWDNVEQRVYWIKRTGTRKEYHEGPLADLPSFGQAPSVTRLTFNTINADKPLLEVFKRIEDLLHSASIGPSKRFSIMLQLLLAKLYDEQHHQSTPDEPLVLQDFAAIGVEPATALATVNGLLAAAVRYYQAFLPEPVSSKLSVTGDTLLHVTKILAPVKISSTKQSVVQDFYMYFARHMYKWDLAQYFTPTPLTDFIIEVLNPRLGEHVKDPACGSADFLTAAFRRGQHWPDYASSVWGSDVSPEAVQVAILNMILNGDGKTNIREEDSLAKISANEETCDVVVCNPPFGARIVERRTAVLANFDLGHSWKTGANSRWQMTTDLLEMQEVGILFAEACVRLLRPGGRMALIVPNGYLGNRSGRYALLRNWLLRHCRIAAIVALPRFTFKGSGADVSASVIFCERREQPLASPAESESYEFCVEVIDRVGWVTGDKKGTPTFVRDPEDGTFVLGDDGDLVLDSDFQHTLVAMRASDAAQYAPWITQGVNAAAEAVEPGWTVSIDDITKDPHNTLDPKRLCRKFQQVRRQIADGSHFAIGNVVNFLPERITNSGIPTIIEPSREYRYVEIQDVETGTYRWTVRKGWELPQRARHFAEPGDVYVGGIRNSVRKWFYAGENVADVVVTNGMLRMRLKDGCEEYLIDLLFGLCSEAYRVQMRGLARGADGLAEIVPEDVATVVLPKIEELDVRRELQPFVDQLRSGLTAFEAKAHVLASDPRVRLPQPRPQPDHTALV